MNIFKAFILTGKQYRRDTSGAARSCKLWLRHIFWTNILQTKQHWILHNIIKKYFLEISNWWLWYMYLNWKSTWKPIVVFQIGSRDEQKKKKAQQWLQITWAAAPAVLDSVERGSWRKPSNNKDSTLCLCEVIFEKRILGFLL